MYILGVETSCDESAASLIHGKNNKLKVLSHLISSQIKIHEKYGGVIPEVAAREHLINLIPTIDKVIKLAKIDIKKIDALAVTKGPGLVSSLMAGTETIKSFSFAWKKPIIAINHLSGHIYANFIDIEKEIKFPLISLIVSGGHTMLVYMKDHHNYKVIGETKDDAAGEAYDKGAKMLNLSYPGGPIISKLASNYKKNKTDLSFPRPMINKDNLDFSFSGLKTALYYQLKKDKNWKKRINEYCYYYQEAINDVLVKKSLKAIEKHKINSFLLCGGVSANLDLRKKFNNSINDKFPKVSFFVPKIKYTTDNASMIASAAYYLYKKKQKKSFTDWQKLKADPNLKLK